MLKSQRKEFEEKVRHVMIKYPESKDDDNLIVFRYWELFTPDLELKAAIRSFNYLYGDKIKNLTRPESITRMRRHIQNDKGDLTPENPRTALLRERNERDERLYFGALGRQHNFGN